MSLAGVSGVLGARLGIDGVGDMKESIPVMSSSSSKSESDPLASRVANLKGFPPDQNSRPLSRSSPSVLFAASVSPRDIDLPGGGPDTRERPCARGIGCGLSLDFGLEMCEVGVECVEDGESTTLGGVDILEFGWTLRAPGFRPRNGGLDAAGNLAERASF